MQHAGISSSFNKFNLYFLDDVMTFDLRTTCFCKQYKCNVCYPEVLKLTKNMKVQQVQNGQIYTRILINDFEKVSRIMRTSYAITDKLQKMVNALNCICYRYYRAVPMKNVPYEITTVASIPLRSWQWKLLFYAICHQWLFTSKCGINNSS